MGSIVITVVYLVIQSICDIRERKISLTVAAVYVGVTLIVAAAYRQDIMSRTGSFMAAGAVAAFSLISSGAIGMGDAIVIGTLAFTHSPRELLRMLLTSFMFCIPVLLFLMLRAQKKNDLFIPFIPFLLAGELINIALLYEYH